MCGGVDAEDHTVGCAVGGQIGGGRVCGAVPSPQLTTTEPAPVVKSATVATWLASVKVAISVGYRVVVPSIPVIVAAVGAGQRGVEDGDLQRGRRADWSRWWSRRRGS